MKNLITSILILSLVSCTMRQPSLANQADKLRKAGKYQEAISYYEDHMTNRLELKDKPSNENPYFYLVLIADCYLDLNDFESAKAKYLEAKEHKVFKDLVSDRIRKLAEIKAKEKDYETALDLLREHRDLDPLLFDGRLDELHKEMVQWEERQLDQ